MPVTSIEPLDIYLPCVASVEGGNVEISLFFAVILIAQHLSNLEAITLRSYENQTLLLRYDGVDLTGDDRLKRLVDQYLAVIEDHNQRTRQRPVHQAESQNLDEETEATASSSL